MFTFSMTPYLEHYFQIKVVQAIALKFADWSCIICKF